MNTLEQWLQEQTKQGRHLYLVLDSDGQLDERNALVSELGVDQYRNLYIGTPADSLANVAPYLFHLDAAEHPVLQALLNTPDRHWGWLASAARSDLDALTAHWQNRLVMGERPNQALYRFHDNRVLGRALAYLQPEQRADYLGLMTSVCYWQAEQWTVIDNPNPGVHSLPTDPAWCHTPTPEATFKSIQFDNTRRYLVREYTDKLLDLAQQQDIDTWLRGQLDLAHTWGWQEPDSIHFLLTQSLLAPDYAPPKTWLPQPNETPAMHFDRVYQETLYWQGDAPV
ncbi:DUF4123 domain-containing protein [Pseudomonas sp. ANT_H14]|uniref:DUF4123 domain-containing protein n=1 Tax=unclassified Pseudomonas TaxID=196821 RepID=UPI0011EF7973|nr:MULTISPECIES: DUF4123 domain-containing protein [unclassified Pseudomonas]KAA0947783.1 DUF4123 domain-containing protein [Pseudomonas sp. ANT_H4]KAA0952355.1 DUF4123 domain-containing protein [Pseudomonas sp. ANT_H14]